jgi:hypothetical protein
MSVTATFPENKKDGHVTCLKFIIEDDDNKIEWVFLRRHNYEQFEKLIMIAATDLIFPKEGITLAGNGLLKEKSFTKDDVTIEISPEQANEIASRILQFSYGYCSPNVTRER